MRKVELVRKLSEKTALKQKDIETVLDALVETVEEELKTTGELKLLNFLKLKVVERGPRTGINPKTGERIEIPARKAVRAKAYIDVE